MKVLGLIVEYNPFHNGHLYHLKESRTKCGADSVICVMSGNFVQRGEPAIVNKWARAKTALLNGADLVIELPVVYAMSSAEFFAYGAVSILNSLGIVDCLCFGSESGDVDELLPVADVLHHEPSSYKTLLRENLDKGLSYPAAREKAVEGHLELPDKAILTNSNNILGIEYLKALKKTRSKIQPLTITRINNSYNQDKLTGNISSASAIRRHISGNPNSVCVREFMETLPDAGLSVLKEEIESGRGPVYPEDFEKIIIALLRKMTAEDMKSMPYVSEGLENRIRAAVENSGSLAELIDRVCTKRYTKTRIQRTLFSSLTGMTSSELDLFTRHGGPQYIRVLGFNANGRQLLGKINENATLPVIVKAADFKKSENPLLRRMLEIEAAATDIYVLAYPNPDYRKAGQEFTQNIIRI